MSELFHGRWLVLVLSKDAGADQRVMITGADSGAGDLPGVPGEVVEVQGAEWTLALEWSVDGGATWDASRIRRSAVFTAQDGLVVTLGADDGPAATADEDFNDLVVVVSALDEPLGPPATPAHPPDFGLPGHPGYGETPAPG
jgi:hypothetical protein